MDVDIEKFIPHRDRMKLIGEVLEVGDKKCKTSSIVTDKWPLFSDNSIDPIVLIELVAQTGGVGVRWDERDKPNSKGSGWLVGIKKAEFFTEKIPLGSCLTTSVNSLYDRDNYAVFEGIVKLDSEIIGNIKIQVFRA